MESWCGGNEDRGRGRGRTIGVGGRLCGTRDDPVGVLVTVLRRGSEVLPVPLPRGRDAGRRRELRPDGPGRAAPLGLSTLDLLPGRPSGRRSGVRLSGPRFGAMGAVLAASCGFAWFVWPMLPLLWEPNGVHSEVYMLNEGLGTLVAAGAAFCALLPFVAVAGYLGSRMGACLCDRLRRLTAGRSAE